MRKLSASKLSEAVALYQRAHSIGKGIRLESILSTDLLPSDLIDKNQIVQEALSLYAKSLRLCKLLQLSETNASLEGLEQRILADEKRLRGLQKVIQSKLNAFLPQDANASDDEMLPSEDLQDDVKSLLTLFIKLIPQLDEKTLRHIKKQLSAIIAY